MTDDVLRKRTLRTGPARFTVDQRTIRSLPDAAIRAAEAQFDAWSNRGMVKPLRLTFRPDVGGPVGSGTPFGDEVPLDAVRVVFAARPAEPWRYSAVAVYPSFDGGVTPTFAALDDFVGAYFHRKWLETEMSPTDVANHFLSVARPGEIDALADDIRALLELDDESIAACLISLDCSYDPADDQSTDRIWLEWMLRQLGVAAAVLAPPESVVVGAPGWQRASRPIRDASPRAAIVRFVKNYGVVDGRASRSEFWWARFLWGLVCVGFVIAVSAAPYEARTSLMIALLIWLAATAIPNITLQARRLHDTGRSGWLMLVQLVPVAGPWILLWWNVADSEHSGARFDHPDEARR